MKSLSSIDCKKRFQTYFAFGSTKAPWIEHLYWQTLPETVGISALSPPLPWTPNSTDCPGEIVAFHSSFFAL
jgi:hypothetical protein